MRNLVHDGGLGLVESAARERTRVGTCRVQARKSTDDDGERKASHGFGRIDGCARHRADVGNRAQARTVVQPQAAPTTWALTEIIAAIVPLVYDYACRVLHVVRKHVLRMYKYPRRIGGYMRVHMFTY